MSVSLYVSSFLQQYFACIYILSSSGASEILLEYIVES